MPQLFKVWNVERTVKKAVVADNIASLIEKGRLKLGITDTADCRVYDEVDGTEIDDDECLALFDNTRVLIIGADWKPVASPVTSPVTTPESLPVSSYVASFVSLPNVSSVTSPAESTLDLSDASVGGYESWVNPGFGTSTPYSKGSDEGTRDGDSPGQHSSKLGESSCSQTHGEDSIPRRSLMEEILESDIKKRKIDDETQSQSDSRPTTLHTKLLNVQFPRAKRKGLKIYTQKEINSKSGIDKLRWQFCNEKAEFLCSRSETANLGKTEIYGLIDVAWTLRKTSLLQDEARKVEMWENDLFPSDENATFERGKKQKSSTVAKNLARMERAHDEVLTKDKELVRCRKEINVVSTTRKEKQQLQSRYEETKEVFDGIFSELRRAQDALNKALKYKKVVLDKRVKAEKDISDTT